MNLNAVNTDINSLKPNPLNPRLIKDEKFKKLVQSIKDFPEMLELRPIVCDENMVILGGNMRYRACIEAGLSSVPVIVARNLSEEKKKEFIIKDNVGFGEWDWSIINQEFNLEALDIWGLEVPDLTDSIGLKAEEDAYSPPAIEKISTDIVTGDVFEIGEHKLLCGSSLDIADWKKILGEEKIDLVNTDPPYNVEYVGKTKDALTIKNDKQGSTDFYNFLYEFYSAIGYYLKPGGGIYVWFADVEVVNFAKAYQDAGLKLAQMLIWVKNSMVMGRKDYHFQHEPCLYGWKEGAAHCWYSDRKQTTLLNFDRPTKNKEHPTMKPVALIAYQVKNSTQMGEIVADGFGGSGTVMVVCEQLQRRARLIEIDPKYCQVIVDRMRALNPNLLIKKNGVAI